MIIFTKIWRKKKMIYLLLLFWVHSVRTKNNISESACNYDFFQSYHDLFSENSGGLIEYANPTAPTCYFLINSYVSLLKSLIYVVYMKQGDLTKNIWNLASCAKLFGFGVPKSKILALKCCLLCRVGHSVLFRLIRSVLFRS